MQNGCVADGAAFGGGLGALVRDLRVSRGLSLSEAARRAGVGKATLLAWESGAHRPRGAALTRLLDILEAGPELRLEALPDEAAASLGGPVHVGQVIRAMRVRRGETQVGFARRLGVAQSTAARWEGGETAFEAALVDRVCVGMEAVPEEHAALLAASGLGPSAIPRDPLAARFYRGAALDAPRELYEVVSLGMETELWRRSARDAAWDPLFCRVVGERANRFFCEGRLDEVEGLARRALRRATTPESRVGATYAVGALVALAKHRNEPPSSVARRLEAWTDGLPDSVEKSWMVWERALFLASMGRDAEAVDDTERSTEMLDRAVPTITPQELEYHRLKNLTETLVRADRAEEAVPLWAGSVTDLGRMFETAARHASGEAAPEAHMDQIRSFVAGPVGGYWNYRNRLAKLERDQARLRGRRGKTRR